MLMRIDEARAQDCIGALDGGGGRRTSRCRAIATHAGDRARRIDEHLATAEDLTRREDVGRDQRSVVAGGRAARCIGNGREGITGDKS